MSRYGSHTISRIVAYGLLWLVAAALLGLTAYRIHFTKSSRFFGGYEPIMVELLVSSILVILWAPVAMLFLLKDRFNDTFGNPRVHHDMIGVAVLWIMWLVGAVYTTNRIIPGKNYCPTGKQCDILVAILALAWTGWSLLTILFVLALLNNAALGAGTVREKRRNHA